MRDPSFALLHTQSINIGRANDWRTMLTRLQHGMMLQFCANLVADTEAMLFVYLSIFKNTPITALAFLQMRRNKNRFQPVYACKA